MTASQPPLLAMSHCPVGDSSTIFPALGSRMLEHRTVCLGNGVQPNDSSKKTSTVPAGTASHLTIHQHPNRDERPHARMQCSMRLATALERHQKIHAEGGPFSCPDSTFSHRKNLKKHRVLRCQSKAIYCLVCNKSFASASALKVHFRIHSGERPYQCQYCTMKFKQSNHLNRHLALHSEQNPFACKHCDARFATNSMLKVHKDTHGKKEGLPCPKCGKRLSFPSALAAHLRTHNGKKKLTCPTCYRRFARPTALAAHQMTHTNQGLEH